MQGEFFTAETLIMPLAEYDLILGIQWLKPWGPILWDFQQEYMQFVKEGRIIKLQMAPKPRLSWLVEDKMLHLLGCSSSAR